MLDWIANAAGNVAVWLGEGVASLIEWLLGGLVDMFTLIFDAADSIWNVFESIWNLGVSFAESLSGSLATLCPFLPEPVIGVIGTGLLTIVIAGIVKKVRGK